MASGAALRESSLQGDGGLQLSLRENTLRGVSLWPSGWVMAAWASPRGDVASGAAEGRVEGQRPRGRQWRDGPLAEGKGP